MSISSSFYTSMSGLFSLGEKMGMLGDNIANINTIGFRASNVSFEDTLLETISAGGVRVNSMGFTSDFSEEGSIEPSHIGTHMAISGDGLFILRDRDDTSSIYYTRAGEFTFDSQGYLVNPGGHIVQGYKFDSDGTEETASTNIQLELTTPDPTPDDPEPVARLVSTPSPSTRLTLLSNLDARSVDHSTSGLFNNWDATSTVPISQNDYELRAEQDIYDSSGDRHSIQVYYDRDSQANVWEYLVTSPPEGTGAAAEDGVLARGSITFNNNGYITGMSIENYQGGAWTPGAFSDDGFPILRTPFGGAESIELDMGVTYVNGAWQNERQTVTQFGYGSYTMFSNADGNGEGDVLDFSISTDGIIRASFDNGVISDLYRVALSDFINPYGIRRMGSSLYQADPSGSGNLITGSPGSSGLGMIIGGSLETSNVDLTEQFGELIFTQRAYQANAKGIVTADEMLKTLIALKR